MRTIKFRGKCVHDSKYAGEWVTGGYVAPEADAKKQDEGLIICYFGGNATWTYHVMPETVGQFTGLHDKNGKEIYEGDLVRYGERNYVVSYEDSHKGAFSLIRNNTFVGCFGAPYPFEPFNVEVVGNIHDYRNYPKGGKA